MRHLAISGSLALALAACGSSGSSGSSSDSATATAASTDGSEDSATEDGATGDSETGEPPAAICETPLSDAITGEALASHLEALAEIAAAHDGNRAAGTSGYEASGAYVEAQLEGLGYEVARWPFAFDRFVEFSPTQLEITTQPPLLPEVDFAVARWSPAGDVSAPLQAVDLQLGLGNQSDSGCEAEDFASAGFEPGRVALIQRGTCPFLTKAAHAQDAGAVAVLIFNQGDNAARLGLFGGSLGSQNELQIPVVFLPYALGESLAAEPTAPLVTLAVDAGTVQTQTFNIVAQTPGGDPEHAVMLGAHLDSVPAGPGVNDNGSGTATVLELARQFSSCAPVNQVRFAWWGGEEWGLHGSQQWVDARSEDELARISLYLNFDMVASPNYVRQIHDGVGGPQGSPVLYQRFVEYFDAHELPSVPIPYAGNSDYDAFVDAGVPAGGLATGASSAKSQAEAATFGGMAGAAYDACYHQACDDIDNFAVDVLEQNARAAAHALESFASDLGELAASRHSLRVRPPLGELPARSDHACDQDNRR